MMKSFLRGLAAITLAAGLTGTAQASEGGESPDAVKWSFAGLFGKYDKGQLQRGFQVFREVCSNCHTMNMPIRMLGAAGGPGFTAEQVKALAAEYQIKDFDGAGEPIERPGKPTDTFPSPYTNKEAAVATYGAYPPNMQVLAKARTYSRGFPYFLLDMVPGFSYQEAGADYIHALVAEGYVDAPADFVVPDGKYYNKFMPGKIISMAPPLAADGQVTYAKDEAGQLPAGVTESIDQYGKDVTAFLYWAAEPHLEQRKRVGFQVMLFLSAFLVLLFFTKKRVWKRAHDEEAHG